MNSELNKIKRSENCLEDKLLLQDLIKERVTTIENKQTDTNTNKRKKSAWVDLSNSFNDMCKGSPPTVPQLKTQMGIIKLSAKKENTAFRKELFKTGGGPPPPIKELHDISSWLPNEFIIDTNQYDSDTYTAQLLETKEHEQLIDGSEKSVVVQNEGLNKEPVVDVTNPKTYQPSASLNIKGNIEEVIDSPIVNNHSVFKKRNDL